MKLIFLLLNGKQKYGEKFQQIMGENNKHKQSLTVIPALSFAAPPLRDKPEL